MADPFDFSEAQSGPISALDPEVLSGQVRPPADPNEMQARVNGWQQFFGQLQSSPDLRNALLSFGAMAMQPRKAGQTQAGQIGQAVQAGLGAFEQRRERGVQEAAQQQRLDIAGANSQAYQDQVANQTRRTDFDIRRGEGLQETERLAAEENLKALRAANTPEMQAALLDRLKAQSQSLRAQARTAGASASRPAANVQELNRIANIFLQAGHEPIQAQALAAEFLQGSGMTPIAEFYADIDAQFADALLFAQGPERNALQERISDIKAKYAEDYAASNSARTLMGQIGRGAQAPAGNQPLAQPQSGAQAQGQQAWEANNGDSLPPQEQERLKAAIREATGIADWTPQAMQNTQGAPLAGGGGAF